MDPKFSNDVRPEFVSTVRQLQPIDVLVLDYALRKYGVASSRIFGPGHIAEDLIAERSTAIQISLKNLTDLGCISNHSQGMVLSA
jgi:hypothetical protein